MSIKLLFLGFFLGAWVGLGAIQAEAAQTQPYVAGTILTTAQYGDKTFVGGTFDSIGQLTGPLGLVDATSGNLSKAFSQITGTVLTITPDSRGGWFIGGVDNSSRGFLVRLKSDMSLDSSFGSNLSINGSVHTVAVHNNLIYFGGQFTKVNGQDRKALVAIDLTSNQLYGDFAISLNPNEGNPNVQSLIVSRGVLYIAGAFESIKGVPRRGVAAIDGAGAVSDFTIVMPDQYDVTAILPVVDGVIISIRTRVNGSTFAGWLVKYNSKTKLVAWSQRIENSASALFDYRGVAYTNVQRSTGGQGFAQFAYGTAFDQATGKVLPWDPHTDGQITSIAVNGQSVYIGGYFSRVGNTSRSYAAAVSSLDVSVLSWAPAPSSYVKTLISTPSGIMLGGYFKSLNVKSVKNFAVYNSNTGVIQDFDANANGSVTAMTISNGVVYVMGGFSKWMNQGNGGAAAFNATNYQIQSFSPPRTLGTVYSIVSLGTNLYVGGDFANYPFRYPDGTFVSRRNLAAFDLKTGAIQNFQPVADNTVRKITIEGTNLRITGDFTQINGQSVFGTALIDPITGSVVNPVGGAVIKKIITPVRANPFLRYR